MSDECNTATSQKRTSVRSQGRRPTKQERIESQEKFLKSFASNGNVRVACLAAGIDRSTIHRWNEHDEQFSMKYNKAKLDVDDGIRAEIFKRAMLGDDEVTISEETTTDIVDGTTVTRHKKTTVRRKSDVLLMFHAKSRMLEYRDKQQVEHTGSGVVAVYLPQKEGGDI